MPTIRQMEEYGFYIYDDIAELFWPDSDYSKSNHTAEERIIARMAEKGCRVEASGWGCPRVVTPAGTVDFDSESGGFECHAPTRGPVAYVCEIIEEIKAAYDRAREVLA